MTREDYCSFEVAKLLKEKGFDEKTLSYYEDNVLCHGDWFEWNRSPLGHIAAPTHQMAMKWLREEKNIFIVIEPHAYDYINEKNSSYVFSLWQGDNYCENPLLKDYPSYEEAIEAALKYSLENLIKRK